MLKIIIDTARGRTKYSTYFLLIVMLIIPTAFFTHYEWLNGLAWLLLITLGAFIFITGLYTRQESINSVNWPKAEAYGLSCSLNYINPNSKKYIPVIKCKFMVKGVEYTGAEYDFSARYTLKDEADEKINCVKAMEPLFVYYKPSDPTISVIKPGVHSIPYIRLIFGVLMVIMPILIGSGLIVLN
ncbi:DUF3592 domain-containing protein [Algibacillus agarilyticus]|uniref:DUF3592 domain-containing protein n=1 Tax=Algibacillus agarilyticus TaxID=2234133 RepID=UPI000DD04034|nr:DUF3592 domain-containing protein [Algibacillus agarilyticus]